MSHDSVSLMSPHETASGPAAGTKSTWPVPTAAWSVIMAFTPINYALPPIARGAWFAAIGALILIPMLTRNVARPLYPAIWIFVGYASIISIFLATKNSTISANLFVGAQLVLLLGLGPFVLTKFALSDPKLAERCFIPFVATQTLSSFVGLLQSAGYMTVKHADLDKEWYGRYPGLTEHQTSLGFMAALAVLLSLQLLTRRRMVALLVGAVCVNIVGIVVSGSLSGVMALLSGLAVAAFSSRNRRHFVKVFLIGSACVLAVWLAVSSTSASSYLPSLTNRYEQVMGQTRTPASVQGRIDSWRRVLDSDTRDPIFGEGLVDTAGNVWAQNNTLKVHNTVLRAWFQGGLFLGIAFALIVVAILAATARAIARRECGTEAGILAAVLAFALVSPLLEQRQFWLPVLVAWGSISAAAIRSRDAEKLGEFGLRPAMSVRTGGYR
jgi:O-antigen ligase